MAWLSGTRAVGAGTIADGTCGAQQAIDNCGSGHIDQRSMPYRAWQVCPIPFGLLLLAPVSLPAGWEALIPNRRCGVKSDPWSASPMSKCCSVCGGPLEVDGDISVWDSHRAYQGAPQSRFVAGRSGTDRRGRALIRGAIPRWLFRHQRLRGVPSSTQRGSMNLRLEPRSHIHTFRRRSGSLEQSGTLSLKARARSSTCDRRVGRPDNHSRTDF